MAVDHLLGVGTGATRSSTSTRASSAGVRPFRAPPWPLPPPAAEQGWSGSELRGPLRGCGRDVPPVAPFWPGRRPREAAGRPHRLARYASSSSPPGRALAIWASSPPRRWRWPCLIRRLSRRPSSRRIGLSWVAGGPRYGVCLAGVRTGSAGSDCLTGAAR
jgi:hypothetical protein